MSGDRLDPAMLVLRTWAAEDCIVSVARRMTHRYDLDPSHVSRMESATLHGDQGELERAVADMLAEMATASPPSERS